MDLSTTNIEDLPGHIGPVVASIVVAALTLTFVTGSRPAEAATDAVSLVQFTLGLNPDPEAMRLFAPPAVPAGPEQPPTIREILLDVCAERGYDETCARNLYGMMWKESLFIPTAVGDNGRALGFFQIHYRMHGVEPACATDVRCSANWTIDYLESNGYPRYRNYAIQCHNGCGVANGYSASAQRWGERKWAEADVVEEENRQALAQMESEAAARQLVHPPVESAGDEGGESPAPARPNLVAISQREEHH